MTCIKFNMHFLLHTFLSTNTISKPLNAYIFLQPSGTTANDPFKSSCRLYNKTGVFIHEKVATLSCASPH